MLNVFTQPHVILVLFDLGLATEPKASAHWGAVTLANNVTLVNTLNLMGL